jgi:hypothetical protein
MFEFSVSSCHLSLGACHFSVINDVAVTIQSTVITTPLIEKSQTAGAETFPLESYPGWQDPYKNREDRYINSSPRPIKYAHFYSFIILKAGLNAGS